MWIDEHPLIFLHLLGGFLVFILTVVKIVLFAIVNWAIRADVLQRNMKKLLAPDESSFGERFLKGLGVVAIEMLLSWISVAVILWQIGYNLVSLIRDQLQPAPEVITELRFPLRNNPDMARETVWAYTTALGVRAGHGQPTKETLRQTLRHIASYYPDFSSNSALDQLEKLQVVGNEAIDDARVEMQRAEETIE